MFKHFVLSAVVFTAFCLPSLAQQQPSLVLASQGCPVGFSARREGSLLAHAGLDGKTLPPAALLNMHFAQASSARIVAVQGTVYGTSAAPHAEPANADMVETTGPRTRTQPFHLTGGRYDSASLDWELTVASMSLIRSVSLSEIRLSDGTTWHESPTSHCRAEVIGLLRVNAAAPSLK